MRDRGDPNAFTTYCKREQRDDGCNSHDHLDGMCSTFRYAHAVAYAWPPSKIFLGPYDSNQVVLPDMSEIMDCALVNKTVYEEMRLVIRKHFKITICGRPNTHSRPCNNGLFPQGIARQQPRRQQEDKFTFPTRVVISFNSFPFLRQLHIHDTDPRQVITGRAFVTIVETQLPHLVSLIIARTTEFSGISRRQTFDEALLSHLIPLATLPDTICVGFCATEYDLQRWEPLPESGNPAHLLLPLIMDIRTRALTAMRKALQHEGNAEVDAPVETLGGVKAKFKKEINDTFPNGLP